MPTLAIDFDDTLTAIPLPIACFVRECRIIGWRVILVTRRYDTDVNKQEIADFLANNQINMDAVILAGNSGKRIAALAAGELVNIWLDDSPETIGGRASVLMSNRRTRRPNGVKRY